MHHRENTDAFVSGFSFRAVESFQTKSGDGYFQILTPVVVKVKG